MRLMAAALILSLTLAVVAAVFALWPVVADAPWEYEAPEPVVIQPDEPSRCEVLTQQLADTNDELAANVIFELGFDANCW